ncbi:MAG: hypothetical protein IZT59_03925 [Verrucomicrobia bacterium]|nr:hypothetical protein [Verrucomicrobiota bacterium]|tara:strand:- start:15495 stop:16040 length:546 start_codon:yes stop_codon:yes gene_type:complete
MDTLPLPPLPSDTQEDAKGYRRAFSDGFVDESVVLSVIAKGSYERVFVKPEDMALSSSEDDYAGWSLPVPSPFRSLLDIENPEPAPEPKRPAAPSLDGILKFSEPGIAEPHRGNHRWRLFAISGAMTCGILSLTLLSLAQRTSLRDAMAGYIPSAREAPAVEVAAMEQEVVPAVVQFNTGE